MKRLFLLIFLSVFIAVSSSYCDHEYGSGFNEGDFRIKDYKFIGTKDNDRIQFDTNADDTVDVTLTSSDITVDEVTYTGTDGAASGYVLITDGSGNTSFAGGGSISAPGSDNQIIYNNDGFFDSNASFLYDEDSNTMNIKSSGALYFGNDTNSYIYDSTYLRIVDTVGVYMTTPAVTFPDDATIGTYAGCKMGFDETADIISFQCDSVTMVSSGYNLAWTLDRANSPSMHFDPWNMTQGTFIDFSGWDGTNPKTLDGALVGIDMDLTTNLTLNNQDVTGLTITLPATYETGTEHAGYFSGDGRTVSICNDDYAIEADGDVNVSSGSDYHVNDVGLSDTKSGASGCSLVGAASVSGATYTTQCHRNDAFGATGQQSGGVISHATGETINVSAGTGFIKATDSDVAELLSFDWVASNGIAIPTNSTRFIGVKWVDADNAPIVDSRVAQDWDYDTEFPLGSVINLGGTLYILNNPWWVTDGITNLIEKSVGLGGYLARDKFVGGLTLGVTATRYPTMTSGTVWGRTNEFLMSAIDYSVVEVASHSAVFDVDNGSSQGTITASTGTPYTVLAEEQTIVITGTGDNDGAYTIHEITGGNVLTMEGVIAGTDGTEATTVIAPSFNTYWFELDGTVHETTGVTQYPVTQWNDIVNSRLTNLLPNKYANLWVFLNVTNNELSLIYPTAYYSGSAKAEAESVPSTIPGDWYLEGMIIGKIVFKSSTDTPEAVLSVFETAFTASLAASHPNLTNLAWTDSGHTGTVSTFAGFDGAGAAAYYTEANYALLAGRSGGQVLIGGTASGDDLTLHSTSNATEGSIIFGDALTHISPIGDVDFKGAVDSTTGWRFLNASGAKVALNIDTVNDRIGIGTVPDVQLHVVSSGIQTTRFQAGGTGFSSSFQFGSTRTTADEKNFQIQASSGGGLRFSVVNDAWTSYTDRMIMLTNGFFGINTVIPRTELEVNGTSTATEFVDSSDSGTSTEWKAGYTHISNNGTDHSYIDQTVVSGSSPTFDGTNFTGIPDGALDTDYVEVAGDTMTGALLIDGTADVIQLKVQSHSTQNANPFEIEDSGASNLFTIDPGGNAYTVGSFQADVGVETDLISEFSSGVGVTIDSVLIKDNSVTANSFIGPLTGNVTGNVSGSSGSCTGNSATANLASTVTVATTTDTTSYVGLFESASGSLEPKTDAGLTYNATTNRLSAANASVGAQDGPSLIGDYVFSVDEDIAIVDSNVFLNKSLMGLSNASNSAYFYYSGFYSAQVIAGNTYDVGRVVGVQGQGEHRGTGTVAELRGVAGVAKNLEGGTTTDAFGGKFCVEDEDGTITNAYGLYVVNTNGAGANTNKYGLYLEDVTGASTLNYSIYSAGGDSYFADNVGIGTPAPEQTLSISRTGSLPAISINRYGNESSVDTAAIDFVENNTATSDAFGTSGAWGFRMKYDGSANKFLIQSGAETTINDRFVLERATGNVGIGTTVPGGLLHVDSIAEASGIHFTGVAARNDPVLTVETTGAAGGSANNLQGLLVNVVGNTGEFGNQALVADFQYGGTSILTVDGTGKVGIGTTVPATKTHIVEASTTAGLPVVTIDQSDVDEPFLKFIGTAASATLTNSIVDVGDVSTATVAGYIKVEVQDDGNQITDQDYYMEVLTLA